MRILALVPARGGSKRLPGKNLKPLAGNPLIVWSIESARDNADICDILVSTDDEEIAAVAKQAGAKVPWLRPSELATDAATAADMAVHALDEYERENGAVDGLLLLQPTSPFRRRETVAKGIEIFRKSGRRSVVSVSKTHIHPKWSFRLDGGKMTPLMGMIEGESGAPTGDAYVPNGCLYLIAPVELRARRMFIGPDTLPLVLTSEKEALDIDTEWDWRIAESVVASR